MACPYSPSGLYDCSVRFPSHYQGWFRLGYFFFFFFFLYLSCFLLTFLMMGLRSSRHFLPITQPFEDVPTVQEHCTLHRFQGFQLQHIAPTIRSIYTIPIYINNTSPDNTSRRSWMKYSKHQQGTPRPPFASTAEHCAQGTEPSRVDALGCTCIYCLTKKLRKKGPQQCILMFAPQTTQFQKEFSPLWVSSKTRELDKGTYMIAGDRIQVSFFLF